MLTSSSRYSTTCYEHALSSGGAKLSDLICQGFTSIHCLRSTTLCCERFAGEITERFLTRTNSGGGRCFQYRNTVYFVATRVRLKAIDLGYLKLNVHDYSPQRPQLHKKEDHSLMLQANVNYNFHGRREEQDYGV